MTLRTMVAPLSFRAARWPGQRLALPRIDLLAIAEALATAGWHG